MKDEVMQLSIRDQCIVGASVMLLLSLMVAFGAYMAGGEVRERAAALASEGTVVIGAITNKVERFGGIVNGPKYTWWLDLTYTTKAGQTYAKTVEVEKSVYDRTVIGPVPVTYIGSRPGEFYIAGQNHYGADSEILSAMSFYGAIVSVVLGLGLVVLLVTRDGGDTPPTPDPVTPPSGPRRQPGQFGTRQRRV